MGIKHVRHAAEVVAIIAAGVWAAYVFVYEERLKPLAEPPRLTITPSWTVKNEGAYDLVSFSMQFRNQGARVIDVAAEEVSAYGMTAGKTGNLKPLPLPEWNAQPQDYLKRPAAVFGRAFARGRDRRQQKLAHFAVRQSGDGRAEPNLGSPRQIPRARD